MKLSYGFLLCLFLVVELSSSSRCDESCCSSSSCNEKSCCTSSSCNEGSCCSSSCREECCTKGNCKSCDNVKCNNSNNADCSKCCKKCDDSKCEDEKKNCTTSNNCGGGSTNITSTNPSSHNITTNIALQNTINNVNRINVPVTSINNNHINYSVKGGSISINLLGRAPFVDNNTRPIVCPEKPCPSCPLPPPCPQCPLPPPCPTCPLPPPCPRCPPIQPCPQCPLPPPCPQCPFPITCPQPPPPQPCPIHPVYPTRHPCPVPQPCPQCPISQTCPQCPINSQTCPQCPIISQPCPQCPIPQPCPQCPIPQPCSPCPIPQPCPPYPFPCPPAQTCFPQTFRDFFYNSYQKPDYVYSHTGTGNRINYATQPQPISSQVLPVNVSPYMYPYPIVQSNIVNDTQLYPQYFTNLPYAQGKK